MCLELFIENKSLRDFDVSNIASNLLGSGTKLLVGVVADGHGHVRVKGGGQKGCTVTEMTSDNFAGVFPRQIGLGFDDAHVPFDFFLVDFVDRRRGEFRLGWLDN
jgi:hypothetical protein